VDWDSLLKFKQQTVTEFLAGKNIKTEASQLDVRFILQLRIKDVYKGGKYDDTCISEIKTALPKDDMVVTQVYLNAAENVILMDTKTNKKIVLDSAPDAVFQLVALSHDKQWVIEIKMPAQSGGSRVETSYRLYNTRLKKQIDAGLLGPDVGDMYDFSRKGAKTYLNYLKSKTMAMESLDLGTVFQRLVER